MKIKVNILMISIVLAVFLFGISTYMQKKMIHYEATVECLVLTQDIEENEKVSKENFKKVKIPISIVAMQKIVTNFKEIEGLYAKDNILSGQIVFQNQFDTRENLSIYEAEAGKEKISIKIKSAENGMAFQIKEKSIVHVYATLRNEYANGFLPEKERLVIGDELDGYSVIKLLENVKVLGTFTIDGLEIEKTDTETIDSILVSVTPEEAKEINLIRDIATFNITGVDKIQPVLEEKEIVVSEASGESDAE